jgi:hypothetical protein
VILIEPGTWLQEDIMTLAVATEAPDFTLPRLGRDEWVQLASFRHHKPVGLIFGSFTCPPSGPRLVRLKTSTSVRVPGDDTSQMRANRLTLVQHTVLITVGGNLGQNAPHNTALA